MAEVSLSEAYGRALTVPEISLHEADMTGGIVQTVYAKYPPHYAVYRTVEDVRIQFSDDPKTAGAQRAKLAALSPLRGQIAALLHKWRTERKWQSTATLPLEKSSLWLFRRPDDLARMIDIYDRRVADALVLALQGATADAVPLLDSVRADIEFEQAARRRIRAVTIAGLLMVAVWFVAGSAIRELFGWLQGPTAQAAINLVVAAGAGATGAFVSLLYRLRDEDTAHLAAGGASDIVLRIATGMIAALLLQSLLNSGVVTLGFGELIFAGGKLPPVWQAAAAAGFVAGFAERLAPTTLVRRSGPPHATMPTELSASTNVAALEDMRQVVSASVRDTLTGPELVRFDGFVTGRVQRDEHAAGKVNVTLHFSNTPGVGSVQLRIEDGVDAPTVEFMVECEPEGSPTHLVTRNLTVPTMQNFDAPPIPLDVPAGTDTVWVEIFQRGRLIQMLSVPMRAVEPARRPRRRRIER